MTNETQSNEINLPQIDGIEIDDGKYIIDDFEKLDIYIKILDDECYNDSTNTLTIENCIFCMEGYYCEINPYFVDTINETLIKLVNDSKGTLICKKCDFQNIFFYDINCNCKIEIHDCNFDTDCSVSNCAFKGDFFISNSELYFCVQHTNFNILKIEECILNFDFCFCYFNGTFSLYLSKTDLGFCESTFNGELNIYDCNTSDTFCFDKCYFNNKVLFNNLNFGFELSFNQSEIKSELNIIGEEVNADKNEINLNQDKSIDFNLSSISGLIKIRDLINNKLKFDNVSIIDNGIIKIFDSTLIEFDTNHLVNQGVLSINNVNTKDIFSQQNITKQIKKENYLDVDFSNITNSGIIEIDNFDYVNIKNRKTARILKDAAYKSNNIIDALWYKKLEMKFHVIELVSSLIKENILSINWWKSLQDLFLLCLNFISNKFGTSWFIGILFTSSVTLLGFFLINYWGTDYKIFEISWEWNWNEFWNLTGYYINILNVINFGDSINDDLSLTGRGIFILFVTRVFIAYGIYQTISAFRKFGKNEG